MANSVDSDQTAPGGAVGSGSALYAYAFLSETLVYKILENLPYPMYTDTMKEQSDLGLHCLHKPF